MKPKKSLKADVDKFRVVFFKTGLILTISAVIFAFSWSAKNPKSLNLPISFNYSEAEELPDITFQANEKPRLIQNPFIKIVDYSVPFDTNLKNLFNVEIKPKDSFIFELPDDTNETYPDPYGFIPLEKHPGFPGGEIELIRFLQANIQYPEMEKLLGIQGKVIVAFIVEADGSLSDIHIVKGVTPNIDNEAIRVIKIMPRWDPGIQRDKAVRAGFHLPIRFILAN